MFRGASDAALARRKVQRGGSNQQAGRPRRRRGGRRKGGGARRIVSVAEGFVFFDLPWGTQQHVLSFLPPAEACRARRVSIAWKALFRDLFNTTCMQNLGVVEPVEHPRGQAELMAALMEPFACVDGRPPSAAVAKLLARACTTPTYLPFLHKVLLQAPHVANATHRGTPLLVLACESHALHAVSLLLLFGADVNAAAPNGWTALHHAVAHDYIPGIGLLTGALPLSFPSYSHIAPIAARVLGRDWESITIGSLEATLLDSTQQQPQRGRRRRRRGRAAELLTQIGTSRDLSVQVAIDSTTQRGETPLLLAAARGRCRAAHALLRHFQRHVKRLEGARLRHYESDDDAETNGMWPRRVNVEHTAAGGEAGDTPLCVACKVGCTPLVRLLLDHGANINHAGVEGVTPLMHAVAHGHEALVGFLLERCPPQHLLNEPDHVELLSKERHALAERLRRRQERVTQAAAAQATEAGEDVAEAVEAALQRVQPKYVWDVGSGAEAGAGDEAVEAVAPHVQYRGEGADDDPYEPEVRRGGMAALAAIAVDVDAVNVNGKTALYFAAASGKTASVRMLLVCNADHRILSKRGKNALYAAVEASKLPVVKVLLSRCTPDDVDVSTNYGTNAMHIASRSGDKPMIDLLLAFKKSYLILEQAREAEERRRLEGSAKERNARAKAQEERMAKLAGLPPAKVREKMRKLRARMMEEAARVAREETTSGGKRKTTKAKTSPRSPRQRTRLPAISRGVYRSREDDWMLAPTGLTGLDDDMRDFLAHAGDFLLSSGMVVPPSLQELTDLLPPSVAAHLAGGIEAQPTPSSHAAMPSSFPASTPSQDSTQHDDDDGDERLAALAARREAALAARRARIVAARQHPCTPDRHQSPAAPTPAPAPAPSTPALSPRADAPYTPVTPPSIVSPTTPSHPSFVSPPNNHHQAASATVTPAAAAAAAAVTPANQSPAVAPASTPQSLAATAATPTAPSTRFVSPVSAMAPHPPPSPIFSPPPAAASPPPLATHSRSRSPPVPPLVGLTTAGSPATPARATPTASAPRKKKKKKKKRRKKGKKAKQAAAAATPTPTTKARKKKHVHGEEETKAGAGGSTVSASGVGKRRKRRTKAKKRGGGARLYEQAQTKALTFDDHIAIALGMKAPQGVAAHGWSASAPDMDTSTDECSSMEPPLVRPSTKLSTDLWNTGSPRSRVSSALHSPRDGAKGAGTRVGSLPMLPGLDVHALLESPRHDDDVNGMASPDSAGTPTGASAATADGIRHNVRSALQADIWGDDSLNAGVGGLRERLRHSKQQRRKKARRKQRKKRRQRGRQPRALSTTAPHRAAADVHADERAQSAQDTFHARRRGMNEAPVSTFRSADAPSGNRSSAVAALVHDATAGVAWDDDSVEGVDTGGGLPEDWSPRSSSLRSRILEARRTAEQLAALVASP